MADLIAVFVTGLMDIFQSDQSRGKQILIAAGVVVLGLMLLVVLIWGCAVLFRSQPA
jgi:hypothetical protein